MPKKTRGGSKSGGTVKSVSDTKDLQSLADFMYNEYSVRVDTKSLSGVDIESVKMAAEGIVKMQKEFPEADVYFHELNGNESNYNTFAHASYYGQIAINPDKFRTTQGISQRYEAGVKSKFHPDGTTAEHIVIHEGGHILEKALIDKHITDSRGGVWEQAKKIDAWNKHKCASDVISRAAKNAKKTPEGKGKKIGSLISEVSGYATKNRSETLAECVADYVANGSKAKVLSREVWKVLKDELG